MSSAPSGALEGQTMEHEPRRVRPARIDGRKFAIGFAIFLVVGTIVATIAALYGHEVGSVARERFEAAEGAR